MKTRIKPKLLSLAALLMLLAPTMSFTNATNDNSQKQNIPYKVVDLGSQILSSSKEQQLEPGLQYADSDFLTINGKDYATQPAGLFATSQPASTKGIPHFIGEDTKEENKIGKDKWIIRNFDTLSINYLNYSDSKINFLSENNHVRIRVSVLENFYNTLKGWSKSNGYNSKDYTYKTFNFELTGKETTHKFLEDTDSSHSSNEWTGLDITEHWDDSMHTLRLEWNLKVWVHWAWGSPYHHGAVIKIMNSQFDFNNTNKFMPKKVFASPILTENLKYNGITDGINVSSNEFYTSPLKYTYGSNAMNMPNFFNVLKTTGNKIRKNEEYRFSNFFSLGAMFSYQAIEIVETTIYTGWIFMNFGLYDDVFNKDIYEAFSPWNQERTTKELSKSGLILGPNASSIWLTYIRDWSNLPNDYSATEILHDGSSLWTTEGLSWSGFSTTTYYYEKWNQ